MRAQEPLSAPFLGQSHWEGAGSSQSTACRQPLKPKLPGGRRGEARNARWLQPAPGAAVGRSLSREAGGAARLGCTGEPP